MTAQATKRQRRIPFSQGSSMAKGTYDYNDSRADQVTIFFDQKLPAVVGTQTTVSEGHPFKSRQKDDRRDLGGDFTSTKSYAFGNKTPHVVTTRTVNTDGVDSRKFVGDVWPLDASARAFPPSAASTDAQLNAAGATAIARCEPTNSVADLSTFLGELFRDGLPATVGYRTWKERTRAARAAGDEYLNVEFGWLPLVSDVRKLGKAVTHATTVIQQFERDAGRRVRRRYKFPVEKSVSEDEIAVNVYPYYGGTQTTFVSQAFGLGRVMRRRETTKRKWFSGAFTYHLPTGYDSRSKMDRAALEADKVFGLSLTPEVLWNLTPWSWAVDWFANVGDVLSNVSAYQKYGLIMAYGYIMEHTVTIDTYSWSPMSGLPIKRQVAPISLVTETKLRRRANPFGFGVSWDGLSPFQLSIAAALGLSRSG